MNGSAATRKPAAERREEIIQAARLEFAANGLAGARLESIAARVGISHPRVVQMFGSKRKLFLKVVHGAFDQIETEFATAEPTLMGLGDAYLNLLRSQHTIGPLIWQSYAAAADDSVREEVSQRHLRIQDAITRLTGADSLRVRTFIATGLVFTASTLLELPSPHADAEWGAWILNLVAQPDRSP